MQKRAQHQEWARLRVAGQPLLTGLAMGTTPLLWVACRTSPLLVHVFQDGDLEAVLRFPSDPIFLLLGERKGGKHVSSSSQETGSRPGAASLLVITADGGIWLLEVPGTRLRSHETNEDLKLARSRRAFLEQPTLSSNDWRLFEDNDAYEGNATSAFMEKGKQESVPDVEGKALSNLLWRNVELTASRVASRSLQPNFVNSEALMAVIPSARMAAFVTSSSVVVVSQTGSPVILQSGCRRSENLKQGPPETSEQKCDPTCLLFASNHGMNHQDEDEGRAAGLSKKLFTSIAGVGDRDLPRYLLLQGDSQGRVHVHAVSSLRLNVIASLSSRILCDLGEPIMGFLTPNFEDGPGVGLNGLEVLLIVGGLGTVVALSSNYQESSEGPFLQSNHTRRMQDIKLTVTDLGFQEWMIKSPVTSACMVGSQLLCYTAGAEVCCAEIFETSTVSAGLLQSQRCVQHLRQTLLHKTVPIADRVYGVAGNAYARKVFSGRPLVALTTRGCLLAVELIDQPASNAFPFRKTNTRSSSNWGVSNARTKDEVKDLLQVVADMARQTDVVRNQCKAINLAIHEIGIALQLAYELSKEKFGRPLLCPALPARHPSAQHTTEPPKGICCMLLVFQPPSLEVDPHQLCFARAFSSVGPDDSSYVPKVAPQAQVSIRLQNHSGYPLSPYWTLILKFESMSPTCRPVAVYRSTVVNYGQGLQIGADFSHDFDINLPGPYLSPVVVSIFLCHAHGYHELLLSNQSGKSSIGGDVGAVTPGLDYEIPNAAWDDRVHGEGETGSPTTNVPGAVCFLVSQYRVDILSLLRPPSGGSSWCAAPVPKRQHNLGPSAESLVQDTEGDPMFGLSGTFSLDGFKQQIIADAEVLSHWKSFHLEDLLYPGAVSKAGNQITLMAPNKGVVNITIENDSRKWVSLSFQTTTESLCCLVREALLHRLLLCEREEEPEIAAEKDRKKLKMRGGKLVAEVEEEITEQPELDTSLASIRRTKDLVEVLAHRAAAVTAEWRKIFDDQTPRSSEKVAPAIAQTYEIVKDLVRAYKVHRKDPASNPF